MSKDYPHTAALLLGRVPEILRRWDQRVRREIPASRDQESLVLQNNLGRLLGEVTQVLSPTGQPVATIEGLTLSQDHGRHRAEMAEYSIDEMFLEYRLLRQTILNVLDEGQCDTFHTGESGDPGRFIVVALLVVDPLAGEGVYASAGAEPLLVVRTSGAAEEVTRPAQPLGIEMETQYGESPVRLEPGDTALLVTDGITEARHGGRLLGFEGMVELVQQALPARSLQEAG